MARNHYIFTKILTMEENNDRRTTMAKMMLVKSSLKLCPLETLILLNTYWEIFNIKKGHGSSKPASCTSHADEKDTQVRALHYSEFIQKFSMCKGAKNMIYLPSYGFPVSLRHKYFSDMGFDEHEIKHLLLSDECFEFKSKNAKDQDLHYTQADYIPIMKERLTILRQNGPKMGLVTSSDYFKVMKHWGTCLTRIGEKAKHSATISKEVVSNQGNGEMNTVVMTVIDDILQELTAVTTIARKNNVIEYLQEYFGYQENKNQLKQDFFELPKYERFTAGNIRNLKLHQISRTLNWFENRGFNKTQIREAMPLIFYHPALLEQKLVEIQDMEEFQPWYSQPEAFNHIESKTNHILRVLLYLIEREFSFTDEGTYFAQGAVHDEAKSMNAYFTESLCNEILSYSGVRLNPASTIHDSSIDEGEQIFGDLNSEHLASLELGRIQFQDYIYLHDPGSGRKPGGKVDTVDKTTKLITTPYQRVDANVKAKNAVRLFSSSCCSTSTSNMFQMRNMSSTSDNDDKKNARSSSTFNFNRGIIISNPFKWFEMKLKYFALANTLDPNFDEEEFKRGAKQVQNYRLITVWEDSL